MPQRRRLACPTPIRGRIRVTEIFSYRGGELYAEEVSVAGISAAVGTPFYLYSAAGFTAQYRRFADAFSREQPLICFAVKANSNLAVLRHFARLGAGADVVSEGELRRALAAGVPPGRIIFSGIGKTADEITCIGTSATLADPTKKDADNEETARRFASRFFGVDAVKVKLVGESYVAREWPKQRYKPTPPCGAGNERLPGHGGAPAVLVASRHPGADRGDAGGRGHIQRIGRSRPPAHLAAHRSQHAAAR